MKIKPEAILCVPLLRLWKGANTPGLRWNVPPPTPSLSGLLGRSLTDAASSRPLGNYNYAAIARDYMNLNARMEFHFALIDTVCGRNPKENYIRFQFKGGATKIVQRERRVGFIAEVLQFYDFFTDIRGDLINGTVTEMVQSAVEERLIMLGRLLGFTRLMDAVIHTDNSPKIMVQAFIDGNYSLEGISLE